MIVCNRSLLSICVALAFLASCKTPNRATDRSDLDAFEKESIKLKEFSHDLDATAVKSLARRIGCEAASQWMVHPTSGTLKKSIDAIYASPAPYDTVLQELFESKAAEAQCRQVTANNRQDSASAMDRLASALKGKGFGLTFVMVGGFGSHLTEEGALFDSRRLWQARFGSDSKNVRIIRHECEPNSFASDDICSPLLIKRFEDLEASRGGVEHKYVFWGYSKGGTTLLKALSAAPVMREKTLALVTVGSPIGGGLPINIAQPILAEIAKNKAAAFTPADRVTANTLLTFGAGSRLNSQDANVSKKIAALFEDAEFKKLQEGFDSISPTRRKKFVYEQIKSWNFSRKNPDPITGVRDLPIFHVAAAIDVAKLNPFPNLTINQTGDITVDTNSYDTMHLAEMTMLPSFRHHPVSDTCVALQHAIIPKDAVPQGAKSKLLAVLKLDHMRLGLSKTGKGEKNPVPNLEIVDALIEAMMIHLGLPAN